MMMVLLMIDFTLFPLPSYTKVAFEKDEGVVGVAVGGTVGVFVALVVGVRVGVKVGSGVGVCEGVAVAVGVLVGPLEVWITSCGAFAPSRLEEAVNIRRNQFSLDGKNKLVRYKSILR